MGKFKCIFVACVGLGIAAGAGYYLYRKFASRSEGGGNNSVTQSGAEKEVDTSQNVSETLKGHEDDSSTVSDASIEGDKKAEVQAAETDSSSQQNGADKEDTRYKKKKSNFGGLRKGFLL